MLIALRFYACGSFYVTIGDFCGVHKSTACRVVQQVTVAICSLRKKFVYLPRNAEEIKQQQLGFMGIARFPKVVSAIGCMHVRIISPGILLKLFISLL